MPMPMPTARTVRSSHETSMRRARVPRRAYFALACAVFAALILGLIPGPAFAAGAGNTVCVTCHAVGSGVAATHQVGFEVPPVVRETACRKCHWEPAGSHPFHLATWNCGSCHAGWGTLNPAAVPRSFSAALGSYFALPSSASVGTEAIHAIHAQASWPADMTKNGRKCGSCHTAAACTACHEGGLDPTHQDHTWSVALGAYAPGTGPSATRYGAGTTPGSEADDSVATSLTCSDPVCHDVGSSEVKPALVDDAAASVTYSVAPRWARSSTAGYLGNTYHAANAAGARADLSFTGQQVEWIGDRGPYRGKARVSIDSGEPTIVDLYAASDEKQAVVFTSAVLTTGAHTLTVEVLGEKSALSRSAYVLLDAFRVVPRVATPRTTCLTCHDAQHADLHPVVNAACGGAGCHNDTDLVRVHQPIGCVCHETTAADVVAAIAARNRSCTACHNPMKTHGAVHQASATFAKNVVFPGVSGVNAGGGGYNIKCLSCHRTNLLANHGTDYTNCAMCHAEGGPRSSFVTWDKTCETGACHPDNSVIHQPTSTTHYHERMSIGEQPNGMCQSCHGNPEGWQCGSPFGCHSGGVPPLVTSVDYRAPVTTAVKSGTDPIVWHLNVSDTGDGVDVTYYSFDGAPFQVYGPAEQASGIVNPADESEPFSHTLRYYSVDKAGNTEATQTTSYDISDTTPPIVTFNGIGGVPVAKSIEMLVYDPKVKGLNTGVAYVHVEVMGYNPIYGSAYPQAWGSLLDRSWALDGTWDTTRTIGDLQALAWAKNSGNWYFYRDFGGNNGLFRIQYYARDYAGNQSEMQYAQVWVDNGGPTTSASKVAGVWRWKLSSYDNYGSSVDKTYYSFDGLPFVEYTAADNVNGVANPGGDTVGAHTLQYYSTDTLGNVEVTKSTPYTIP